LAPPPAVVALVPADLADLVVAAQVPDLVLLVVEAQALDLADLVVEAEGLVDLLSRQSFSAAMARTTP
jgi:hypothetical protein